MKPRTLLMTLILVGGFWYITSRADWNIGRFLKPMSANGRLWSEPATAKGSGYSPDETNNIDIYKAARLATVNITSIVYQERWFFQLYPAKGTGSGFIIND
jgi:hypothetical protein